jgi:hypothetical protein
MISRCRERAHAHRQVIGNEASYMCPCHGEALYVYPSPSFFSFILIIRLEGAAAQVKVPRMYYQNFDTNITAKYAVVIKNWPLSKFCSPGDVGSLNELEILYNAFESGATYFQHLTDNEFREWTASRVSQDSQQENNTFGSAGASKGKFFFSRLFHFLHCFWIPVASTSTPMPPQSRYLQPNMAPPQPTVPAVTSLNGTPVVITKKPRKARSDKGKARGPRNKVDQPATAAVPA